ncbi:MAG: cation:proton antiporter [Gallionella sp.]
MELHQFFLFLAIILIAARLLSETAARFGIPPVIGELVAGLLVGPSLLGIVTPQDFGKMGSVIATIALVVILFESGTSLNLGVLDKSLATTGVLSLVCFVLTAAIVALAGVAVLELGWLPAALLGVTLGGTSSAVVIPMVESLRLSEKPATVLVLESALTDVLCIVGVFALLQVYTQGGVEPGRLVGGVLAALILAAVIGVLGGIGWLLVLGKVRDFPNTTSSTLAYVFIVYGVTEQLGFSGAISALALGITMTNFEQFGLTRINSLSSKSIEPLNEIDRVFYRESVFLLKTYFFVYMGISIHFGTAHLALTATAMTVLVFAMRTSLTRFVYRDAGYTLRDSAMTSMMASKGLAAAVLAGLPLQHGVVGGEIIRDTTYMVVLVSISLCALLVAVYPLPGMQKFYSRALGKPLAETANR